MQKYLKAIYGGIIAGITAAQAAYVAGGGHIGWVSAASIALAGLGTAGGVLGVTNAPSS